MIIASFLAKKAAISIAKTGSLAPQFIKGKTNIVAILSLEPLKVLVAITPGTAQPPAIPPLTIKAITELPCRPNQRKILSIMYAILAMYPESSRIAIAKNINMRRGTKLSTLPTPSIMPETIRDLKMPSGRTGDTIVDNHSKNFSSQVTGASLPRKVNS